MKLFGVIKCNQLQMLPAAGHQQAFPGQQAALVAAVGAGKAAVTVFGIGNDLQLSAGGRTMTSAAASKIGPPAEKEYAVEPVGVASIMPSLR